MAIDERHGCIHFESIWLPEFDTKEYVDCTDCIHWEMADCVYDIKDVLDLYSYLDD